MLFFARYRTVLYEMTTGQFPFRATPPESVIWQVGSGQKHPLDHVKCSATLKVGEFNELCHWVDHDDWFIQILNITLSTDKFLKFNVL